MAETLLLEVGVEGMVHAAEEGCGNGCGAKFTILHRIDPTGHPAATDECLVGLGLVTGRSFASQTSSSQTSET